MILRDELSSLTPRLRRYARALITGDPAPCDAADDLVHATLMRAIGAGAASGGDLAVRLYATVTQLHRERPAVARAVATGGMRRPALVTTQSIGRSAGSGRLAVALLGLPLELREALLLVVLEGFDYNDASRILRVSRGVLVARLAQARTTLDKALEEQPVCGPARKASHLRLVT